MAQRASGRRKQNVAADEPFRTIHRQRKQTNDGPLDLAAWLRDRKATHRIGDAEIIPKGLSSDD